MDIIRDGVLAPRYMKFALAVCAALMVCVAFAEGASADNQNNPPKITITSPVEGSSTTAPAVTVTYTVSRGNSSTCDIPNGESVGLTPGWNHITVNCVSANGAQGSAMVSVLRGPTSAAQLDASTGTTAAGALTTLNLTTTLNPLGYLIADRIILPPQISLDAAAAGDPSQMCPASSVGTGETVYTNAPEFAGFTSTNCPESARIGTTVGVQDPSGTEMLGDIYLIDSSPVPKLGITFNWFGIFDFELAAFTSIVDYPDSCDGGVDPMCPKGLKIEWHGMGCCMKSVSLDFGTNTERGGGLPAEVFRLAPAGDPSIALGLPVVGTAFTPPDEEPLTLLNEFPMSDALPVS